MKRRNLHFHESLYTFWDQQRPKLASTWRQHQIGPYWMIRKIELHSMAVDQCAKSLSKIERSSIFMSFNIQIHKINNIKIIQIKTAQSDIQKIFHKFFKLKKR